MYLNLLLFFQLSKLSELVSVILYRDKLHHGLHHAVRRAIGRTVQRTICHLQAFIESAYSQLAWR